MLSSYTGNTSDATFQKPQFLTTIVHMYTFYVGPKRAEYSTTLLLSIYSCPIIQEDPRAPFIKKVVSLAPKVVCVFLLGFFLEWIPVIQESFLVPVLLYNI